MLQPTVGVSPSSSVGTQHRDWVHPARVIGRDSTRDERNHDQRQAGATERDDVERLDAVEAGRNGPRETYGCGASN